MRVVGGTLRSRALRAPKGDKTRPTTDRVREALFSILQADGGWLDKRVLDLYAGTGALGIEALSRGAESCTFVERDRDALMALRDNVESLGLTKQVRIVAKTVDSARREITGEFALIFVDPPYAEVPAVASQLSQWVAKQLNGQLVFEHNSKEGAPQVAGLAHTSTRVYGDSALSFYVPAALATGH
jgi:16S rRNA (guanine966-N2)-methyltransferase